MNSERPGKPKEWHSTVRGEIPCQIPAAAFVAVGKVGRKSSAQNALARKFPAFPAPFPATRRESADFGQNLTICPPEEEKFAANFAAAGNLANRFQPHFGGPCLAACEPFKVKDDP